MGYTRPRPVCTLPWVLALGLLACASGQPPEPTSLQIAGMQAKTIVIAPLNLASSLPGELEGSSKIVMDALVGHLEAHGKTVRILGFRLGRNLWREAVRQVKASGKAQTFERATHFFALEVREKADFDVLIIPTLYVQNAKVWGMVGSWDGRKQNMKTSGKRPMGARWMEGTLFAKAASIMIFMVDARGDALHSSRHGLELTAHIEWEAKSMGLSEGDRRTDVRWSATSPLSETES